MGEEFDTLKNAASVMIVSRGWVHFPGSSKCTCLHLVPASLTCMINSSTMKMGSVMFI